MTTYIESETVELKSKFTDSICKEIVAFLNAKGGDVIIGVNDSGKVVGLKDPDETSKKVSDILTDQIEPNPQSSVTTEIRIEEGVPVLLVHVQKGERPLYCQKKYGYSSTGCVIRIGAACKSMTEEQIRVRYERNFVESDLMTETPAKYGSITLKTLKIYYAENGYPLNDSAFEENIKLRTASGKYNVLAELLSDRNMVPIIVVRFQGKDKSALSERNDYGNKCLLFSYEQIKNRLLAENICFSDTTKRPRIDRTLFDFDCVNEAVINALVHNDWNISQPLISIFDDRIEILSHGGLPKGQTKEDFFRGVSRPRNDMLMRIFLNMNLTEHTGHGIPRIISRYGEEAFRITNSYVLVTIPFDAAVLENVELKNPAIANEPLKSTEKKIIALLRKNPEETAKSMAETLDLTVRTVERNLTQLQNKGWVVRIGSDRTGNWSVIK